MMSERRIEFFDCQCDSFDHVVRFELGDRWAAEHFVDLINLDISVHLNRHHGFLGRMKNAIKYVFGRERRWGDYDVTMLKHEDIGRLSSMIDEYRKLRSKYENQSAAPAVRAEE